MNYKPDEFTCIKLTDDEGCISVRILAIWYGNFSRGSSWKFSSAVEQCNKEGNFLIFKNASGNVYTCNTFDYHLGLYAKSVLNNLVNTYNDFKFEIIEDTEDVLELFKQGEYLEDK